MVVAALLGFIAGIVGFVPLIYGARLARQATATSNLGEVGALLLGVLGSFAILAGAVIACVLLDKQDVLAFAGAEAAGLIIFAVGYGVRKILLKK